MVSLPGIITGAAAGLAVTVAVTLLWPRRRLAWLKPIAAALVGLGVAYLVMRLW